MEENNLISRGNVMLHIAMNPDGSLQPFVNARIPFGNMELLMLLLRTDKPGAACKDNYDGSGYLFMYDNNRTRPYQNVMIWKYRIREDGQRIICDMEKGDMDIIPYAVKTYMTA